jgi:hypothetical protein
VSLRLGRRGIRLNWGIVLPVLAGVGRATGAGMLVCCVTALAYGDGA